MKKRNLFGQLCVFGSAIIFGFTPILVSISYRGGNNGVNMAFLRALLPIPALLLLGCRMPWPGRGQWKRGIAAGFLSFGCTLLLYSSYEYISPGLATTLHFLYPVYVTLYEAVRTRRKPGRARIAGLILGLSGSLLFLETGESGQLIGFILAIGSGMAYALYIIVLGKEARNPMPLYRLMLLISIAGVALCGAVGLAMGKITFALSAGAWLCVGGAALLVAVVGCVLFQRGVREVGEANAAIYSLFEPIMSVLFSVWMLHDALSIRKIMGCALILGSLLMLSLCGQKKS